MGIAAFRSVFRGAFRSVGADDDPSTLASVGARRTLAVLIVAMRVSSGVVGAAVALAGMAPPARPAGSGWPRLGGSGSAAQARPAESGWPRG